ncbi:DUF5672 family protein [Bergeyella cardium]|uniref:Uncharacterized protein n=1 Tax=Bergeyella cardium TaxID=1585976 RepID=A0A6P1QVL3_9FLAO|nr:DUF5672 family protein [Bergeyella cardium]QHN65177.1 hypothetical protein DBX24_04345 [Bergeyella cardium]WHE34494.1 DUF5672 family protein [Bergeyella cardium]WHF61145.1 DUF5672 family protein [Bergeyella cardium]
MVDIVIPVYKETPDEEDIISLRQLFNTLGGKYPVSFIYPKTMNIEHYKSFGKSDFIDFDDYFFKGIQGYNQLMLNLKFYKTFCRKYLLIYQTDALVFSDELSYWCTKNYDYIGAPWLRSRENIPLIKKIFDKAVYFIKKTVNYRNNGKWQKDKSLLYNNVGNGGFSLRKREKFIEVLERLDKVVKIYSEPINQSEFYAEDVFFSVEPERNGIPFSKPDFKEACAFSIENKPEKAMEYNRGKLPFGCHRWNKENKTFWKKYL